MPQEDIKKIELVWPGKFNADGGSKETPGVNLPFQIIETINENQSAREFKRDATQATLFDIYIGDRSDSFDGGWKNKLIWGDNLPVMGSLLANFQGRIDLIYIDPPFATGADFSFSAEVGESKGPIHKEQSIIEEKAYRDTWGGGIASFVSMIRDRLVIMRDLLSENGSIYVHSDWRVNFYLRFILNEIFGEENFRNEIAWCYPPKGRGPKFAFHRKHDTILYYGKNRDSGIFNRPHTALNDKQIAKFSSRDDDGRRYKSFNGRKVYLDQSPGRPVPSWWDDIGQVGQSPIEFLGYPTQKPESLLTRVIETSSERGGLVADFFCGSGTSLVVAEKLGRRWIGCDLGRWGVHITRKRLLDVPNCKPFEVLNLGKYERQYWQSAAFVKAGNKPASERTLYEYLAFILNIYGAQPISGLEHVHGKKGRALVRVGSVDAPVTIDEIDGALTECVRLKQRELHVLGWEWEMGVAGSAGRTDGGGPMLSLARSRGVDLVLLQIPREVMEQQAVDRGDVRFFELAYLDARLDMSGKSATVTLSDFVIPNPELVPDELRRKVGAWSDFIDYWAVDWDFRNDTFMQGWVAYRTRKDRALPLSTTKHSYERPGRYRVLVKVIDIFGNDTSRLLDAKAV